LGFEPATSEKEGNAIEISHKFPQVKLLFRFEQLFYFSKMMTKVPALTATILFAGCISFCPTSSLANPFDGIKEISEKKREVVEVEEIDHSDYLMGTTEKRRTKSSKSSKSSSMNSKTCYFGPLTESYLGATIATGDQYVRWGTNPVCIEDTSSLLNPPINYDCDADSPFAIAGATGNCFTGGNKLEIANDVFDGSVNLCTLTIYFKSENEVYIADGDSLTVSYTDTVQNIRQEYPTIIAATIIGGTGCYGGLTGYQMPIYRGYYRVGNKGIAFLNYDLSELSRQSPVHRIHE